MLKIGLRACSQENCGIIRVSTTLNNVRDMRRGSSIAATTVKAGNDKQKTMDDLDGPSFMTSLYWLFGKGYFQTTQQLQVRIAFSHRRT